MSTLAPVQAVPVRVTAINIEDYPEPEHTLGRAPSRNDPEVTDEQFRAKHKAHREERQREAEAELIRKAAIDGPLQVAVQRRFDLSFGDGPHVVFVVTPSTPDDAVRWQRLFAAADRDTGAAAEFDRLFAGPLGDPVRTARERLASNLASITSAEAEIAKLNDEWRKAVESGDLEAAAGLELKVSGVEAVLKTHKRMSPILEEAVASAVAFAKEAVAREIRATLKARRDAAYSAAEDANAKLVAAVSAAFEEFIRTRVVADAHAFAAHDEPRVVARLVDQIAPTKRVREVEPNLAEPRRVRDDQIVRNDPEEPPVSEYCGRHDEPYAADRPCRECRKEARQKSAVAAA